MSVYAKENPSFFSQCLKSIADQTVAPDELIIVKDGPLTDGLEEVIGYIDFPNKPNIISLPENVTQGPARAEGVKAAKNEWIAIMDSDDICVPDRFEKQISMIERDGRLSLIGGQISEFASEPGRAAAARAVPLDHASILKFSRRRNPFNCMTVMMRRDLAISAGNFRHFPWFEDYDLWMRMICKGAFCANHPDVLTYARVGGGMYARRRGVSYVRSELRMQRRLRELGVIGFAGYVRNVAVRTPARLLPAKTLAGLYNIFARKNIT